VVAGGFVYEDGDAAGVYRASWCTRPDHPTVKVLIAVGEFWRDDVVADAAIALDVWPTEATFRMQIIGEPDSPWSSGGHIGPILSREEALRSPHKERILHVAEHVCTDDQRVNEKLTER
jgi:hypothetical protein